MNPQPISQSETLTEDADNRNYEHLRILSFNIQVGIDTNRYSDYIRKSWRHVLPHSGRHVNLSRIASLVKDYDIVALQEVDAGSLRSGYVNQVEFIADKAGFPHWHVQQNRRLAKVAAHANGLLSKMPAELVVDHSLPGVIPGRGALQVSFGCGNHPLNVMVVHLALGKKARSRQLAYIAENLSESKYFAVMGDMNCEPQQVVEEFQQFGLPIKLGLEDLPTYPSWNPKRAIDHILVSESISITRLEVLPEIISDHLAIAMDIRIPKALAENIKIRDCVEASHTH